MRADVPGHDLRFHFVDDGSTDGTGALLRDLAARHPERVGVSSLPRNAGKGEAVRHGMRVGLLEHHDYVGFWDADLATPLSELPPFVQALESDSHTDIVFGARVALLGRRIDRKAYRHAYGRVFATAVSQLLALHVYDTQCGAKLFRANRDLEAVLEGAFLSRWIFDVELLARYIARYEPRGIEIADRVVELPLGVWTDVAGSKVGMDDAARALVELALIGRRYRPALVARRLRV